MTVLVGIPTRNRGRQLTACLDAVASSAHAVSVLEIVVVDNGDEPVEISQPLDVRVEVIRQAPGLVASRNTLLQRFQDSDMDALVFVDDDQLVRPTWLAELLDASAQHPDAVIAGQVDYAKLLVSDDPAIRDVLAKWSRGRPAGRLQTVGAGNTLVPRTVLDRAGWPRFMNGLDAGGEDTAFFGELAAHGIEIWAAETAVADELFEPDRLARSWFARRECVNGRAIAFIEIPVGDRRAGIRVLAEGGARVVIGVGIGAVRALRWRRLWPQDFNELWGGAGRVEGSMARLISSRVDNGVDQSV